MTYTFDESVLSDLHKEAFGFRPSASYYTHWRSLTDQDKQIEWDNLCAASDQSEQDERDAEARNYARWQTQLEELIRMGAGDKATAIRWDMQAQNADPGEVSFYCYARGLSYKAEDEIHAMLNQDA
jgi:hypothetical protein